MSLHAALEEMNGSRSENGHVSISRSNEDSSRSMSSSNDHSSIFGTPVQELPHAHRHDRSLRHQKTLLQWQAKESVVLSRTMVGYYV
jgi:hypothetical protein